jgi:hypothetical protein
MVGLNPMGSVFAADAHGQPIGQARVNPGADEIIEGCQAGTLGGEEDGQILGMSVGVAD